MDNAHGQCWCCWNAFFFCLFIARFFFTSQMSSLFLIAVPYPRKNSCLYFLRLLPEASSLLFLLFLPMLTIIRTRLQRTTAQPVSISNDALMNRQAQLPAAAKHYEKEGVLATLFGRVTSYNAVDSLLGEFPYSPVGVCSLRLRHVNVLLRVSEEALKRWFNADKQLLPQEESQTLPCF